MEESFLCFGLVPFSLFIVQGNTKMESSVDSIHVSWHMLIMLLWVFPQAIILACFLCNIYENSFMALFSIVKSSLSENFKMEEIRREQKKTNLEGS